MQEVCQNIKAEMGRRDMTQEQLAKMLDVSPATVRHRLEGRRAFTLPEMAIMATYFGCTIDALAGRKNDKEVQS